LKKNLIQVDSIIKEISYNMTVDGSKRYPCSSELHHVLEKIPVKWLEKALQKLDDISPETLSKFEEDMNIFVIDGSAITCETLSERIVAMKPLLMREFHKYLALIRITTNTIRRVKKPTNKIRGIINYLPEGSLVLADTEFDAENNYRIARESKIDLQVKQRKGDVRKPCRKRARRCFDKEKYRLRKLGERPFGNIEVRRYKCYYRKPENKLKGVMLIACEHNIRAYFKNKSWSERFIKLSG